VQFIHSLACLSMFMKVVVISASALPGLTLCDKWIESCVNCRRAFLSNLKASQLRHVTYIGLQMRVTLVCHLLTLIIAELGAMCGSNASHSSRFGAS
jgi:hypothetical protein